MQWKRELDIDENKKGKHNDKLYSLYSAVVHVLNIRKLGCLSSLEIRLTKLHSHINSFPYLAYFTFVPSLVCRVSSSLTWSKQMMHSRVSELDAIISWIEWVYEFLMTANTVPRPMAPVLVIKTLKINISFVRIHMSKWSKKNLDNTVLRKNKSR